MKKDQLLKLLIVLVIFFLFSFLRFYNLEKRLEFEWDQERDAFVIKNILDNHKLTLLGPRVLNDNGFFLGPYFYYLLTPFYFITNLNPKATLFFIYFFNIFFFIISFLIIKKIFNLTTALFFLFFWSINPFLIKFDITSWNVLLIPIGVIINWLIIYKKTNNPLKEKNFFILGLFNGLFLNFHLQFIFIIIFNLFFLLIVFFKKKIKKKFIFYFVFGLSISFIPLLIFDLRHNFLNIKIFLDFIFNQKNNHLKDLNIWWSIFGVVINSILLNYKNPFINQIPVKIFYFAVIFFLFCLIKLKKNFYRYFYQSALLLWLIFPLVFIFYSQRPSEYYFVFLYPFIYIILIDSFITLKKQLILIFIAILILSSTKKEIKRIMKESYFSLYYKELTAKTLKKLTYEKKFNISYNTEPGRNHGFRYFLDYYQIKQSGNLKDPLIEIRIPPKENDIKIGQMIGIKIPKELKD